MPIGEKAIPKTFPNAQHEPRKKGKRQSEKMKFPGLRKNPTKKIKYNKHRMKNDKKPIAKMEPEIFQGLVWILNLKIATM